MALSALVFRLPRGLDRRGRPNPNAGSRRSAGWDRATVARAAPAVRRRGAPLSTGTPAAAEAGCAATRGLLWCRWTTVCVSSVDRLRAYPLGAPSARRDSGGTTRVAVRARSTECRTGSTPGSPDQPSPGDDAGRCDAARRAQVRSQSRADPVWRSIGPADRSRAAPNRPPSTGRGVVSGARRSPAARTVTYGYPQFPQVYPQRPSWVRRHQYSLNRSNPGLHCG